MFSTDLPVLQVLLIPPQTNAVHRTASVAAAEAVCTKYIATSARSTSCQS